MIVNVIRNENCIDTMREMNDEFVDLVVTSPPYDEMQEYEGYMLQDFELIAAQLFRVIKSRGVVVWIVGDQTKIGNNKTYWQSFEYMFVFSKDKPKTINLIKDRKNKGARAGDNGTKRLPDGSLQKMKRAGYEEYGRRTNVWEYMIGSGHSASDKIAYQHPAIFPEKLAHDHILSWSNKGDLVYDPFMGSGTVALMAKLSDRDYIGSEINENYCEIAKARLNKYDLK